MIWDEGIPRKYKKRSGEMLIQVGKSKSFIKVGNSITLYNFMLILSITLKENNFKQQMLM